MSIFQAERRAAGFRARVDLRPTCDVTNPKSAHAFVTRVLGPAGQKILLRYGFLPRKKP